MYPERINQFAFTDKRHDKSVRKNDTPSASLYLLSFAFSEHQTPTGGGMYKAKESFEKILKALHTKELTIQSVQGPCRLHFDFPLERQL